MFRFLAYLLVFVIGGAIGFFAGGVGGGGTGVVVGTCKIINESVKSGAMTQDAANQTLKSVFSQIAAELKQSEADLKKGVPEILKRLEKESQGQETACQVAFKSL